MDPTPLQSLISIPSLSDYGSCPECGRPIRTIKIDILGTMRTVPIACECIEARAKNETVEREKRDKARRIERLFRLSQLGERFAECTFESWQPRPGTEKAHEAARRFVSEWGKGTSGLLIYGGCGNGKSHLAAAIVNELVRLGVSAVFQNVPALFPRLWASYSNDNPESEYAILNALIDADLLVLDDLGAETWNERKQERLYEVINGRYMRKAPVIITANLDPNALRDRVGERIADRIVETCLLVPNTGDSARFEKAVQRSSASGK